MSDDQPAVTEVEAETSFMGSEDEEMVGRASWHSESDPLVTRGKAGSDSIQQQGNMCPYGIESRELVASYAGSSLCRRSLRTRLEY